VRTLEIRNSAVSLSAYFPSRKDIESLKLGDLAPNAFGKLARVVAITNRREDVSGKLFACYTVEGGERSTITNLMKENEVIRTIDLHSYFKSVEIDTAQRLALSVVRTNEAHWSPQVVTLNS
jgi:hypothetical protein